MVYLALECDSKTAVFRGHQRVKSGRDRMPVDPASNTGEEPARDAPMTIREVLTGLPFEGDAGSGLLLHTNRGDIPAILHQAPNSHLGVIWVCGARGGFSGPAGGIYARLAGRFVELGITSLRLNYRQPNVLPECVLDLLAGVALLKGNGYLPVVLVGHSFGGAVVIAAGVASSHVQGVVSLSPQTYGASLAGQLTPRPLLVVHGKSDTRLPYSCGLQIHSSAKEPKKLVLYEGAEHRLEECRDELEGLLEEWIPATLSASIYR
jgi:alpha/beta superfamily hydrolase